MSLFGNIAGIIIGIFFGGFGVFISMIAYYKLKKTIIIWNSDPDKLSEVKFDSSIEVEGEIIEVDDLEKETAPISGKECYGWKIKRYKKKKKDRSTSTTKKERYKYRASADKKGTFVITDGESEAEVDPEGADIQYDEGEIVSERGEELPETAVERIERLDNDGDVSIRSKGRSEEDSSAEHLISVLDQRYKEWRLEEGDVIHVIDGRGEAAKSVSRDARIKDGGNYYTITLGDENKAIKKSLVVVAIFGVPGLIILSIGGFLTLVGLMGLISMI